jgi:hypothetical protein
MKAEEQRGIGGKWSGDRSRVACPCEHSADESVCEHTLYAWRQRLAEKRPVSFAVLRVQPGPTPSRAALEVLLPGGELLQIAPGVDIRTLRTVLTALRERG